MFYLKLDENTETSVIANISENNSIVDETVADNDTDKLLQQDPSTNEYEDEI